MSKVNSEKVRVSEIKPDAMDIPLNSQASLSGYREPLFRRLIGKALSPGVWQGLVVIVDQGFCSIANFLTGVLVARACSKAEYGLYVLGFTLLVTAMGIQVSLTGIPFTVLSPPLKGKDRRFYLGSTLIQHLAVSAMTSVGFIVAATVVFTTGRTDSLAGVLFALAVASVFVLLRDFMRYVLLVQLRVRASLLMGLTANIATVGMLFWAYMGGWLTAPVAYLIMAGCSGIPVLFVLLRERKQIAFSANRFCPHVKMSWRIGKWLAVATICSFFAIRMYPWALTFFKGTAIVGEYGVCVGIATLLNPVRIGFNRYLGPKTAHAACKGIPQVRRIVYLGMVLLSCPFLLFLLGMFIFGEWMVIEIYGSEYAGIGDILIVYCLSFFIAAETEVIKQGVYALQRPDIDFKARVISVVATATLGIGFVYKLGVLGVGLGLCISRTLEMTYEFAKFRTIERIGPWKEGLQK